MIMSPDKIHRVASERAFNFAELPESFMKNSKPRNNHRNNPAEDEENSLPIICRFFHPVLSITPAGSVSSSGSPRFYARVRCFWGGVIILCRVTNSL